MGGIAKLECWIYYKILLDSIRQTHKWVSQGLLKYKESCLPSTCYLMLLLYNILYFSVQYLAFICLKCRTLDAIQRIIPEFHWNQPCVSIPLVHYTFFFKEASFWVAPLTRANTSKTTDLNRRHASCHVGLWPRTVCSMSLILIFCF